MANNYLVGSKVATVCFVLLVCGSLASSFSNQCKISSSWQAKCYPGSATYYEVLDEVFPQTIPGNPFPEEPYMVLRFLPLNEPELQIIVLGKGGNTYEIHLFTVSKGSKRISEQVSELKSAHPQESSLDLAKRISIEHSLVKLNEKTLSELMKAYRALRISPQVDPKLVLDASGYDFWAIGSPGCNTLHLSLADGHNGHDSKAHPLVRWMNSARDVVEKAAAHANK